MSTTANVASGKLIKLVTKRGATACTATVLSALIASALLVSCGTPQLTVPRNGCAVAFPVAAVHPNVDAIISGAWAPEVCGQVGGIAGQVTGTPIVATALQPGATVICSVEKPTFLSNEGRVGYGAAAPGETIRFTKYLRVQIIDTHPSRDDLEACGELRNGNLPF